MQRQAVYLIILLVILCQKNMGQRRGFLKDPGFVIAPSKTISLADELEVFNDGNREAKYRISLGADVPDNRKPQRLMYQLESGHVFLLLQKISKVTGDTLHKVFGFYPARQGWQVFTKREVPSVIKDNSGREHDVSISLPLEEEQFRLALELALHFAERKYHLNHFNCYDYAVNIFNAVTGDLLPVEHRRFFIFGSGGSPCPLYKYLVSQLEQGSALAAHVRKGRLVAPLSSSVQLTSLPGAHR